jgi:hypothetical protein
MAGNARQTPPLGPSPIPIHDNGNMLGQAVEIDLDQEFCFDGFCLHGNSDLVRIGNQ